MNSSLLHRIWICLIIVSPCIIGGITAAFSSIAVPEMNLSLDAASWFSCLFTIAAPFGSLASGYVIDKFGRKPALILSVITGIIGWILIATYNRSLWQLFSGRFFTGFSAGAVFFPGQVYLAEFIDLDPNLFEYRASFTCAITLGTNLGFFLVIVFGVFFPYKTVAYMVTILSIFVLVCICTLIPESPVWLYQKGKYGDAEWSQKRLKLSCSFENYPLGLTIDKENRSSSLSKLKRRDVYVPLCIASVCLPLLFLCGPSILSTYLINLIQMEPKGLYAMKDSYYLSAIAAGLQLISSAALIFVVPCWGARKITIGASLVTMVGLLTYGIAFYFTNSVYKDTARGVGIVAIWLLLICCGFGFVAIPRAALGEIFPPDANGFAAVPAVLMYIAQTIIVKIHPYLAMSLGGFIFIVYAGLSLLLSVFLFYYMPETVGKKVSQINSAFCEKPTLLEK